MDLFPQTCPKIVELLGPSCEEKQGQAKLKMELVDPNTIPQPYYRLLVHKRDMTSTLTAFHGEEITLRVLRMNREGDLLARHVVLVGLRTGRPVEYGTARIRLNLLSDAAREKALEGQVPLGGILNRQCVRYTNCPGGFFRVWSNALISQVLEINEPQYLFGRCNCLANDEGHTIAEVAEILPPDGRPPTPLPDV